MCKTQYVKALEVFLQKFLPQLQHMHLRIDSAAPHLPAKEKVKEEGKLVQGTVRRKMK